MPYWPIMKNIRGERTRDVYQIVADYNRKTFRKTYVFVGYLVADTRGRVYCSYVIFVYVYIDHADALLLRL